MLGGMRRRRPSVECALPVQHRRDPPEKGKTLSSQHQPALGHEWATLQDNHEQYERSSLAIKLGAVVVLVAGLALGLDAAIGTLLMLILWLQEAIFRTSQARLGQRILRIEQLLAQSTADAPAYQLHSEWLATRPGVVGLLAEYARNMLRPTVAFPYLVLLAMGMVW
jgi:hypothetical protein